MTTISIVYQMHCDYPEVWQTWNDGRFSSSMCKVYSFEVYTGFVIHCLLGTSLPLAIAVSALLAHYTVCIYQLLLICVLLIGIISQVDKFTSASHIQLGLQCCFNYLRHLTTTVLIHLSHFTNVLKFDGVNWTKIVSVSVSRNTFEANFLYAFEGQSFWRKSLHSTDTGKTGKQVKQGEKRHRL